jgi:hypothetical protein
MARPEDVYREFVRRSHRLLAVYLTIYAWTNDLDCVVLTREEILKFWGVKSRVERERRKWLKEDVERYFPHVNILFEKSSKFATIYLARRDFPEDVDFRITMPDTKRIDLLSKNDMQAKMADLPSESEMLSTLTSVNLAELERHRSGWFEPAIHFTHELKSAEIVSSSHDPATKLEFAKSTGSNFRLVNRELICDPRGAWTIVLDQGSFAQHNAAPAIASAAFAGETHPDLLERRR